MLGCLTCARGNRLKGETPVSYDPQCCRRVSFHLKCTPYPLLLSMIDDGPKKNEAGKIDFGTASLVVDVHTSFCRIYTSDAITYSRTETALYSPPSHPSGGRRRDGPNSGWLTAPTKRDSTRTIATRYLLAQLQVKCVVCSRRGNREAIA